MTESSLYGTSTEFLQNRFVSSALVATFMSWSKRGVWVTWDQVVSLPRIVWSKAFFADMANHGIVSDYLCHSLIATGILTSFFLSCGSRLIVRFVLGSSMLFALVSASA